MSIQQDCQCSVNIRPHDHHRTPGGSETIYVPAGEYWPDPEGVYRRQES